MSFMDRISAVSRKLIDTSGGSAPKPDKAAPAQPQDNPQKPALDAILDSYQVQDDEIVEWTPNMGPFPLDVPFVDGRKMTATEAELLDQLAAERGLLGLQKFQGIMSNDPNSPGQAYATADQYYPQVDANGNPVAGGEDGHNDAFRHAYFNALLTKHFGPDFAAAFATAHEGVPGNPADKEAMDLYNNEAGRRIAMENPDASEDELAQLIDAAIKEGEMVVIDGNGELAFSDQVEVGQTGSADDPPRGSENAPPDYDPGS